MQDEGPSTTIESDKPLRINSIAEKALLVIGEKLPLVVLFILAAIVIATQNSEQAFSESKAAPPNPSVAAEAESFTWVASTPTPTPIPPIPTATPTPTPTATPARNATHSVAGGPTPTFTPIQSGPNPVDPGDNAIWDKIAECESHQNWGINSGNGYFGGLQFTQGAWNSVGGTGEPHQASRDEQINRGKMLQEKRGWGVWGECSRRLGLN